MDCLMKSTFMLNLAKILLILVILMGCSDQVSDKKEVINWVLESDDTTWRPRDYQGEMVLGEQMWIIGGWTSSKEPNLLDVWKSGDGIEWERTLESGPWEQTDIPISLSFNGKMWLMGGRKVPGSEVSNKVWSSNDGTHWTLETNNAGWSPRLGAGYAVSKDGM